MCVRSHHAVRARNHSPAQRRNQLLEHKPEFIGAHRHRAPPLDAALRAAFSQRSSNVAESVTDVDVGVPGDATTGDTVVAMCPSRLKALVRAGPGWPRAQKSRSPHSTRSSTVSLDFGNTLLSLDFRSADRS
jgi:hypothetical protein